ncbi:MAG TPA: sigma-70 family RNA polymerase sigma factor [Thermoanaerobaculia bacterium]|nr:sigma-70 family RNA polymerase sigma factor [Thermoanaerobaculia bacterium]
MTRFPDTRGSLVAAVKSGDGEARARALETLAEAYWKPVYTYVRLKAGREHDEAADLTQEFFARLVEKEWLERFDPSKARLRTYLRVLVDGLVANEWKARNRLKRGGGISVLSLDFETVRREVEERSGEGELSPEDFFEKEWVRSVFSMAVERFDERCTADGHALRFALFSAYDLEGDAAVERPRYEDLARRFETSAVDVTNQLAAARRDFRRILLDLLRELTVSDAEFRAEARALLGVEPPA